MYSPVYREKVLPNIISEFLLVDHTWSHVTESIVLIFLLLALPGTYLAIGKLNNFLMHIH